MPTQAVSKSSMGAALQNNLWNSNIPQIAHGRELFWEGIDAHPGCLKEHSGLCTWPKMQYFVDYLYKTFTKTCSTLRPKSLFIDIILKHFWVGIDAGSGYLESRRAVWCCTWQNMQYFIDYHNKTFTKTYPTLRLKNLFIDIILKHGSLSFCRINGFTS